MITLDQHAIAEAILSASTQPPPACGGQGGSARLSWERVHPAHSYRIDPTLHDELKRIRDELTDDTTTTTLDLVADAIIAAGIEAYARGEVQITCMHTQTVTRGRR